MWKPQDMLLVIGELTMEKRVLEDQIMQLQKQLQEKEKPEEGADADGGV